MNNPFHYKYLSFRLKFSQETKLFLQMTLYFILKQLMSRTKHTQKILPGAPLQPLKIHS